MSKSKTKAVDFFQKKSSSDFVENFEVIESSQAKNFRAEFNAKPLTEEEDVQIQLILQDESDASITEEKVTNDHKTLLDITSEIKAINIQSQILHGERIAKARDILKKYKDGAYSRWQVLVYGNRQTPNRMLQFYELFTSLPNDAREQLRSMPKRAAYVLAARDGDQSKKLEIIKEHHDDKAENIIQLVQETFPLRSNDRRQRKENNTVVMDLIRLNLMTLLKRKNHLTDDNVEQLEQLRALIDQILSDQKQEMPLETF